MKTLDWAQFALFLGLLAAVTKPLGLYLVKVLDPQAPAPLDRIVGPLERLIYRLLGLSCDHEQTWWQFALSLFGFSLAGLALTFAILMLQGVLPWNPDGIAGMSPALAFNTAVSFVTNTNWQSYAGESAVTPLAQMIALAVQNFASAAAGIAVAAALVRGIARVSAKTLGSFWVDVTRLTLHLFLPLCVVYAVFLMSQGVVQTGAASGTIPGGPVASQVAIKMLGTNGGGYFNANAAHPFENPTPLSNFVQMLSIFAIGSGLTWWLGRMVKSQAHGWAVWGAMMLLFTACFLGCWMAEAQGNPLHHALGVVPDGGNMEGKEVRFGVFNSALFAAVTTSASCGAVNAMHDSFTPLGGLMPLFLMQLGEVVVGGVGAGLYGMLLFVVLAVFIAGLMVGRTPEYLGKKIAAFDVKMAMIALLVPGVCILVLTAWACRADWGLAGLNNTGPHGFSEILYAYTSAAANNGSAFAGLTATPSNGDPHWNLTLAVAMLLGRFGMIAPILALAGSLAGKKLAAPGPGTFPVTGFTFVILLTGTVLLIGALNFLPAVALGPVVEHFLMGRSLSF